MPNDEEFEDEEIPEENGAGEEEDEEEDEDAEEEEEDEEEEESGNSASGDGEPQASGEPAATGGGEWESESVASASTASADGLEAGSGETNAVEEAGEAGSEELTEETGLEADPTVDLPAVDDDVFYGRDSWPDASEEDFEEDAGDWSADDYQENSQTLFGWREDFGQTSHDAYVAQGFSLSEAAESFGQTVLELLGPGSSSIRLYEKDGAAVPKGFLNFETLASLAALYPLLDLSHVHVTVPKRPEAAGTVPRALPDALQNITPADCVDLRKYCTPVGDQGHTSRCAAFAWTHAIEMLGNIQSRPVPPLSCSFTMLRFQHRQGDAKDFKWAWKGGDGTQGTWEPGKHVLESGTCRQELWPDDHKEPKGSTDAMENDARNQAMEADVYDIGVEDMKRLLTAGLPVQISMATGEAFQDIGPDGIMKVAEKPSGDHGYHAMLCVGYLGNYFIIKNSWGEEWGDAGYCYIPKKVLMGSEPEPVAIVPFKPKAAAPTSAAQAAAPVKSAPVRCKWCRTMVPPGASCAQCGGPLRQEHKCVKCKADLPPSGVLCGACGTRNG